MKPELFKIAISPDHSFGFRHDYVSRFTNQWHYHPEFELVYIIQGTGRQFIGDHLHHFKPGDLVLLGANLPHLWRSDEVYFQPESTLKTEAFVLHFTRDCLGKNFFDLPENINLKKLLERARQAVRIKAPTRDQVRVLLYQLEQAKGSERIILLLQILQMIAGSKHTRLLCSKTLEISDNPNEQDRLNTIYQYIFNHFTREISLHEIAQIAHMSPHSFCRYFKTKTNKTFSRFLLEIRTGHAAKLLAETHAPVADICYESGFNNFSNFNRHFKAIIGRTPLAHRKYYQDIRSMVQVSEL